MERVSGGWVEVPDGGKKAILSLKCEVAHFEAIIASYGRARDEQQATHAELRRDLYEARLAVTDACAELAALKDKYVRLEATSAAELAAAAEALRFERSEKLHAQEQARLVQAQAGRGWTEERAGLENTHAAELQSLQLLWDEQREQLERTLRAERLQRDALQRSVAAELNDLEQGLISERRRAALHADEVRCKASEQAEAMREEMHKIVCELDDARRKERGAVELMDEARRDEARSRQSIGAWVKEVRTPHPHACSSRAGSRAASLRA